MCKYTYVPHTFLFRMFITYLMYKIVTIIKVNGLQRSSMIAHSQLVIFKYLIVWNSK